MTASKPIMAVSKPLVGYYIPMDVIVALMFDNSFGTARFLQVKLKASSNAFPIYRSSSRSLHPWASALFRKRCKDTKFLGICIALSKKRSKIRFHKACETEFWPKIGRKASKSLEDSEIMPIFTPTNPACFP